MYVVFQVGYVDVDGEVVEWVVFMWDFLSLQCCQDQFVYVYGVFGIGFIEQYYEFFIFVVIGMVVMVGDCGFDVMGYGYQGIVVCFVVVGIVVEFEKIYICKQYCKVCCVIVLVFVLGFLQDFVQGVVVQQCGQFVGVGLFFQLLVQFVVVEQFFVYVVDEVEGCYVEEYYQEQYGIEYVYLFMEQCCFGVVDEDYLVCLWYVYVGVEVLYFILL